ncbi:MAG TPA: hypothetical protein VM074_06475 [Solimonas sp.]|nr:hypothetical protein [Solimonas sp.]
MTLDLDGSGLVGYSIDSAALGTAAGVQNLGQIVADGGMVVLTAQVARSLVGSAVNNQGRITAHSIEEHEGTIFLTATGGNVTQAGLVDASGAGGANGGTVRLLSNRDVNLTGASQTLANGAGGGNVRVIADGTLTYARGARMNVGASALLGPRGFAELSGHRRVSIGDVVELGRGGHLLIDPSVLRIGNTGCVNAGTCDIEQGTIESQLFAGSEGALVDFAASDAIIVQDLDDNALDGTNPSATLGAGLRLRIGSFGSSSSFFQDSSGSITFDDVGDVIRVDGDLILQAGSATGQILAGGLESTHRDVVAIAPDVVDVGGAILAGGQVLLGAGSITTSTIDAGSLVASAGADATLGAVQTQGDVSVTASGAGFLQIASIQAGLGGVGFIDLTQSTGNITTGAVSTTHGDIIVNAFEGSVDMGDVTLGDAPGVDGHRILINAAGDVSTGILSAHATPTLGNANLLVRVTAGGAIDVAGADLGANVGIGEFADDVVARLELFASSGDLRIGDVNVTASLGTPFDASQDASALVTLSASNGSVTTGNLLTTAAGGSFAGVNLTLQQDGAGAISVGGSISAHANPTTTGSFVDGPANVIVRGTQITVAGAVDVSGVGNVNVEFTATPVQGNALSPDVVLGGPVFVQAGAGVSGFDDGFGNSLVDRTGNAVFAATAGNSSAVGDVRTGDVTVFGPMAFAQLGGGRVIMTDSNADGVSLHVSTPAAGDADANFFEQFQGGQLSARSTWGLASALLIGAGGGASNPSILTDGGISVVGPSAQLDLRSRFGVVIGNDQNTQAATLDVQGLGYVIDGDFGTLGSQHRPNSGQGDVVQVGAPARTPQLSSGHLEWGEARLDIGGVTGSSAPNAVPAGAVLVFGDISVQGQGSALATILADSLDLDGVGGAGGAADVGAQLGLVQGTIVESSTQSIGGNSYSVTRDISDGNNGAARWGEANLLFTGGTGGNVEMASVHVAGGQAGAEFDTGGTINITGNALVEGGIGQFASLYHEVAHFTPVQTAPPLADAVTHIVGDLSFFGVGLNGAAQASDLSVGGLLSVEGTGIAAAIVDAALLQLNDVNLEAEQGQYTTTHPGYVPDLAGFGDAVLFLQSPGAVIGDNVNVAAANTAHVGGRFDLTGDFTVQHALGGHAQSIDQIVPGDVLGYGAPMLGNTMVAGLPDVALAPLVVDAANITLLFDNTAALQNAGFTASNAITIRGNRPDNASTLLAGNVNWSAGSIDIQQVSIVAGTMTLAATGDLGVSNTSELHYTTGNFDAGGNLTLSDVLAQGNTHTLHADGVLTLDDADLQSASGGTAVSVDLDAGSDILLDHASLLASTLQLSAAQDITLRAFSSLNGNLTASAVRNLTISFSDFNGATGNFSTSGAGGAITIDGSQLDYINSLTIASAGSVTISNSQLGAVPLGKAAGDPDIDITAVRDLAIVGNSGVVGDRVRLLSSGGSVILQANISATHLIVDAGADVRSTATGSSTINVDALDITGDSIALDLATLNVGAGLADNGGDPGLLAALPPALRPASARPNAAFIARSGGVAVQQLNLGGDYLFVKADSFSGTINAQQGLFFNLRSNSDPLQGVPLLTATLPQNTTLALGGTGFLADIQTASLDNPVVVPSNANLVFLTAGRIAGSNHITTGGQVVVLGGTLVESLNVPPQPPPPELVLDTGAVADLIGVPPLGEPDLGEQDQEHTESGDPGLGGATDGESFVTNQGDTPPLEGEQCL